MTAPRQVRFVCKSDACPVYLATAHHRAFPIYGDPTANPEHVASLRDTYREHWSATWHPDGATGSGEYRRDGQPDGELCPACGEPGEES